MNSTETDSPEDEAWIEAEIQRQLDALTPEDDNDQEDKDYQNPDEVPTETDEDDDVDIPDSVKQYLERVQHRSEDVEKDLQECDDLLEKATKNQSSTNEEDEFYYESAELKELAFQLGEDPEELRDRVMSEVQKDELQDAEDAEREDAQSRLEKEEDEKEMLPSNQEEEEESSHEHPQKDTMVVAVTSASDRYEQAARAKIRELEGRHSQMDHVRHKDREQELQVQARRDRQLEEARMLRHRELDAEQQKLAQEKKVTQAKAKAELEKETKEQEESLKKYQAEIEEFAKKMQEEKDQLERQLKEEKEKKDKQVHGAAVTIQAAYRSYRARKPYLKKLHQLRDGREERKIQLRQMEIAEQRKQAEMKKKKDKAEKKKREEAEKKKQEELQRKLELERKEQERREKERKEMEQKEKERQEAERLEAEKKEKERMEKEKERLEKEKLEMEQKTQDILAKIAAEKAGEKSVDMNKSEQSTDSKTPATGDDSVVANSNNIDHQDTLNKDANREPSSGDLNSKGHASSQNNNLNKDEKHSEEGAVLAIDRQQKSEYGKLDHVDHSNLETGQSHPDSLRSSRSSIPNQSQDFESRTKVVDETKPVLDSNDNIHNKNSEHGNSNKLTKDTSNTISNLSSHKIKERTLQSQPSIAAAENAPRSLQNQHIGNSNNHASTQETRENAVVRSNVGFEMTPFVDDARAPSSDDLCIAPGTLLEPLPEDIEKLRLQWMEKCTSLSKLLSDSKQRVDHSKQRRQLRRPRSAKKLQDLTEDQIIAGSGDKTALDQVSTVLLEDLPGFNLSTLKQCPRLQCLTAHRCGLTAVEGLDNSPDVITVNVQHNGVESVNCRDRSQLSILQLAHNHLSNLQGLEGCPCLRWLEVQHNKLTRISGIESVSSLTHLYASHNQLINTAGLDALACLQRLDLSHNHLSTVPGIEKCCLLRRLNLSRNSLTEIPVLTNHVLLRELYLDDNSLSNLDVLTNAWLPLLTTLSVSQNSQPKQVSLSNLDVLTNAWLPLLTTLSVSQNSQPKQVSLSNLDVLTNAWLPLLTTLSVSQNSQPKQVCLSNLDVLLNAWLPLLTTLSVSQNSQPKQVSLPNLDVLTNAWLPLLTTLSVSQNSQPKQVSLSNLDVLTNAWLPLLTTLSVSQNSQPKQVSLPNLDVLTNAWLPLLTTLSVGQNSQPKQVSLSNLDVLTNAWLPLLTTLSVSQNSQPKQVCLSNLDVLTNAWLPLLTTLSVSQNSQPKQVSLSNLDVLTNAWLPLLTTLSVSQNSQPKQVSLSNLDVLTNAWLPLLTTLSVSQNSLPKVPILKGCRLLKVLDISHNFIADVDCLIPGLEILDRLEQLSVVGNPVTEEQNCRYYKLITMATASEDPNVSIKVMEEDLSCNICYNLLREPKELDCYHVFCLQCLQEWVKKGRTVECPECRHITIVPPGGLVDLKTNLRLKSMTEKYAKRVEKQKGVPICPNHEGEKQHFFCITCGVTVCHNCLVLEHERPQHEIKELKVITKMRKIELKAKIDSVQQKMKKIEGDEKKLNEIERKLQAARDQAEKDVKKRHQEVISEAEAKSLDALVKEVIIYSEVNGEYKRQFSLGSLADGPDGKITEPLDVAVTSEGKFLVTHRERIVKIFLPSGRYEKTGVGNIITTTPDDMIVIGNYASHVITVHQSDGELIREHKVNYKDIQDIASNGKQIAITTGSTGNSIHVIDFVTGQVIWIVDMTAPVALTREFLETEVVDTPEWRAKSPDLSPLEHLWDILKRKANEAIKPDTTLEGNASEDPDVSIKVMEEDLSCYICYNLLREPKELDCPHVFCLQCLQKWVKKGRTVECPECRHITIVPQGGLVNLKTNLRLKSMAEKYAERVEKQKGVPICPNHEGEKQHFFCVTCGVTVCHNCLVLEHERPQHEIKELKVITKMRKTEVKAKMDNIKQKMKKIEGDEKKLNEIERRLQAARDQAEKDVKKRHQEVISEAEAKLKDTIASIQATYQQRMDTLKKKQNHANDMVCRLRNVYTATENVVDTAADHVFMKQHKSLVDQMNKLCISQHEMPSSDLVNLQFNPGSGTVSSSWFGEVVEDRKCELKLVHEFGAFQKAQGVAVTQTGLLAVIDSHVKEVIIYHKVSGEYKRQFSLGSSADGPDGKVTGPFSVAVTSEGKFFVTHSGRIVKIFLPSGRYEKTLTGVGDIITTTLDDMIVIGSTTKGVITVHQSDGVLIRTHQVDCTCKAIASNGKQIAFTTGRNGNSIHVIDFVTGQVIWTVDMILPHGICYEPKTNTLFVAGGSETRGHHVIYQYCSTTGHLISRLASSLSTILSAAPHLKKLDEDVLPSNHGGKGPVPSQIEAMCLSQMQAQDDLQNMQQAEIENLLETHPNDILRLAQLRTKHMDEMYKQAEEHRYMHEYGDMTIIARQPNKTRSKGTVGSKDIKEKIPAENYDKRINTADGRNASNINSDRINQAATQIQAYWRGYTVRRDIAQHTTYWLAAGVIQSAWRGYVTRRDMVQNVSGESDDTPRVGGRLEMVAATKIQALWRGHSVRKRLKLAKQTIKFDEEEDMFGEIDLTSFEFNEESIEQGWLPAATPVLPSSHPILPPAAPHHPHKPSPPTGERPLSRQPRQAWRNADSPLLDPHNKNILGKPPLPPTSSYQDSRQSVGRLNLSPSPTGYNEGAFDDRSQQGTPFGKPPIPPSPSTVLDTPRSNRSNKTDKLSEEWGFKDSTTAELMMRRAKKLNKGSANRKKKMLDPIQRYQKMVKTQDTSTSRVAQVPKKGVQRKEYFKAREEEIEHAYQEKKEEDHEKKSRTFEWVHNQVGDLEVSDSRINPHGLTGRQSNSEPNLPHMSPDVILGGRVQLMVSVYCIPMACIRQSNSEPNLPHMSPDVILGGRVQLMVSGYCIPMACIRQSNSEPNLPHMSPDVILGGRVQLMVSVYCIPMACIRQSNSEPNLPHMSPDVILGGRVQLMVSVYCIPMACIRQSNSEPNLPHMSPDVILGGRVQLMVSGYCIPMACIRQSNSEPNLPHMSPDVILGGRVQLMVSVYCIPMACIRQSNSEPNLPHMSPDVILGGRVQLMVGVYCIPMACIRQSNSEPNLPHMSPDVILGGRVQLMVSGYCIPMACIRQSNSEPNLPHMSPDVILGGRVQLMVSVYCIPMACIRQSNSEPNLPHMSPDVILGGRVQLMVSVYCIPMACIRQSNSEPNLPHMSPDVILGGRAQLMVSVYCIPMACIRQSNSEPNLPHMSPDVILGGRVQLMVSGYCIPMACIRQSNSEPNLPHMSPDVILGGRVQLMSNSEPNLPHMRVQLMVSVYCIPMACIRQSNSEPNLPHMSPDVILGGRVQLMVSVYCIPMACIRQSNSEPNLPHMSPDVILGGRVQLMVSVYCIPMACIRQSNSEPNLPHMSPDVILGGRVQLMASPTMELQSVDGASSVASLTIRNRSNSYSSPDVQLPPIKTNSAPTSHYKERAAAKQATVTNVHVAWGRTPRSGANSYR
ncbi:uncharacterized protein [Amphiura filiformis]|uniref:uncharacterized protein n=1 Tax=Amphiura filiformis TaxID=82378 RepID=UPI003B21F5CB